MASLVWVEGASYSRDVRIVTIDVSVYSLLSDARGPLDGSRNQKFDFDYS